MLEDMTNWVSPRLGIRFVLTQDDLEVYYPEGQQFLTTVELTQQMMQEKQRADQEKQRADQEKQRAERLAQRLRELNINPDEL